VPRFFILGFFALPLIEIALFIQVGRWIGLLPTLALIVLAALLGGLLLRQQGLSVLARLRGGMTQGQLPGRSIFDTMAIGVAALLLILPGFLSDAAALALLLPPVRAFLYAALARNVRVVETTTSYRRAEEPPPGRIGGVVELDEDDYRPG